MAETNAEETMNGGAGGQDEGSFEAPFEEPPKGNSDDGMLAAIILGAAIAIVIIGGYFYRRSPKKSNADGADVLLWESSDSSVGDNTSDSTSFKPPTERQSYLDARQKLDGSNPEHVVTLKKLLMMRAIKTIPMLYELQNGGPSVDRLYKKGMLTDAMHNRFINLKQYIDAEFAEVQEEAERLVEGWGQVIWPQANQYYQIQTNKSASNVSSAGAGEEDDDEDDSIISKLQTSPKKNKNKEGGSDGGRKQKSGGTGTGTGTGTGGGDAAAAATAGMSEEEKAEYHAARLLQEEEGGKKKGGAKRESGGGVKGKGGRK